MNYYHLKAIRQNHSYHYNAKIGAVVKAHALGGVYMGKLAPARVSYRDDFVISYHVYIDDWVISYYVYMKTESKSQTRRPSSLTRNYACATRSSLPANRFQTETNGRFAFT